jgi:hypothetical protein
MNFKSKFEQATNKAKEIRDSETTAKACNKGKEALKTTLEVDGVKQIASAAGAGALIGIILPVVSVGVAASLGAVLGAYKFIVK